MKIIPKPRAVTVCIALIVCCFVTSGAAQSPAYTGPRTADHKPDLNGIWQAMNTANWDLSPHTAQGGPVTSLGAQGAEPGGIGVVEGGSIPYLPEALKTKAENYKKRFTDDPEIKCYMPGVPRAVYMPFPFQIVQSAKVVMVSYEFAAASRTIFMGTAPAVEESWMGTSEGHWEGDTLVVEVTKLINRTWFDRAGDFHSDALHVTERYTRTGPATLLYEATISDPATYTKDWKIAVPMVQKTGPTARLMEYECQDLAFGQ